MLSFLGSQTDLPLVTESRMVEIFQSAGVMWEVSVVSCHRHSEELQAYCCRLLDEDRADVFIAIAGMSAALPGAITTYIYGRRPVIGVPYPTDACNGQDALLSMVRLPTGTPVAVAGLGRTHAVNNAALLACQIIGVGDHDVQERLGGFFNRLRGEKPPRIAIQLSELRASAERRRT